MFFEDINRAGDGGLYPEMLRNRAFEDSVVPKGCVSVEDGAWFETKTGFREPFSNGEGDAAWAVRNPYTPVPAWYCDNAEMKIDLEDTLNKNREASLKVAFRAGGSIWNIGYNGIPAEKGKPTLFYAFWKADKPVTVKVSIVGEDGTCLSSGEAKIPAGEWGRSDVRLVSEADDFNSRIWVPPMYTAVLPPLVLTAPDLFTTFSSPLASPPTALPPTSTSRAALWQRKACSPATLFSSQIHTAVVFPMWVFTPETAGLSTPPTPVLWCPTPTSPADTGQTTTTAHAAWHNYRKKLASDSGCQFFISNHRQFLEIHSPNK